MMKFVRFIKMKFNKDIVPQDEQLKFEELVNYSVKKYHNTYKLLEEYDKKSIQDPEVLADSERLQKYFRKLRRDLESRRATARI